VTQKLNDKFCGHCGARQNLYSEKCWLCHQYSQHGVIVPAAQRPETEGAVLGGSLILSIGTCLALGLGFSFLFGIFPGVSLSIIVVSTLLYLGADRDEDQEKNSSQFKRATKSFSTLLALLFGAILIFFGIGVWFCLKNGFRSF